jgi:hypothetical protein
MKQNIAHKVYMHFVAKYLRRMYIKKSSKISQEYSEAVNWRWRYNTIAKRKFDKKKTMITLHRKLKIHQHEPHMRHVSWYMSGLSYEFLILCNKQSVTTIIRIISNNNLVLILNVRHVTEDTHVYLLSYNIINNV